MPRVAKPKAAKTKAVKKPVAESPAESPVESSAEDLNLSPAAPAEAPPHESDERYARVPAEPPANEPAQTQAPPAEAPRNGDTDSEMVLRPPTRPVETTESDTEHERRERRVTGAETAPSLKINIAELQAMSMTDLNNMARDLGIENSARCASTRLSFTFSRRTRSAAACCFQKACWKFWAKASASCAR